MGRATIWLMAALLIGLAPGLQAQESFTPGFGGQGGNPFRSDCGPAGVVVGFNARLTNYIEMVEPICQKLTGKVATGPFYSPRAMGGNTGALVQQRCNPGAVVIGLYGQSNGRLPGMNTGNFVNGFVFVCGRWAPMYNRYEVESRLGHFGRIAGTDIMDTNTPVGLCPTDYYAVGVVGRMDLAIVALAMICRPLPPVGRIPQR